MVRRSRGPRSKSRYKMTKEPGYRGMPSVSRMLKPFEVGDDVTFRINPAVHKGMPPVRFLGLGGVIEEKRGLGYVVRLKDKAKVKKVTVGAIHLSLKGEKA